MLGPYHIFTYLSFLVLSSFLTTYFFIVYNNLLLIERNINKSWASIDALLLNKCDQISKLLNIVKPYMDKEKNIICEEFELAKEMLEKNAIEYKAIANNKISNTLKTVLAMPKEYVELQSNQRFINLKNRIKDLEFNISDRIEFYNDSANYFNIKIQSFPGIIIAFFTNFNQQSIFFIPNIKKCNEQILK